MDNNEVNLNIGKLFSRRINSIFKGVEIGSVLGGQAIDSILSLSDDTSSQLEVINNTLERIDQAIVDGFMCRLTGK